MNNNIETDYFATCPKGLEGLLEDELKALGAQHTKQTTAGVFFGGTLETAYQACLWSRLASRILLHLFKITVDDVDALYKGIYEFPWLEHLPKNGTLCVDFSGESECIRNTQFGALKVKDAIVDSIRDKSGWRPNIDKANASLRVNVFLYRGIAQVSLDLSGYSLHRRGYRLEQGEAPLKENLAAALLLRANWPQLAKEGAPCLDPLCGSGTILIEAALMASDTAPGLMRRRFGFETWLGHEPALWQRLRDEANARREKGMLNLPEIFGYDASPRAISMARDNIARAGFTDRIRVSVKELAQLVKPTHHVLKPGLLITNPPYGERLGEVEQLKPLFQHFGERIRQEFLDWQVALFVGNPELGRNMGIRARHYYNFFNGHLACRLLLFHVTSEWFVQKRVIEPSEKQEEIPTAPVELSPGAQMFANRLAKNLKQLESWAQKNKIECYRVYDADMPEYAVAIDRYQDYVHVQEYAPPKTIDPEKATARLNEILSAIPQVLNVSPAHVIVKQRKKQKITQQYSRFSEQGELLKVQEHGCLLWVNLTDYIDTGLFLDHRPLRLMIQQRSKGKRFLNLFCYTGSATVHAAKGGAHATVSVDLSSTYLNWARKNLALNGFSDSLHQLHRADCLKWLDENNEKFDLILLDPPTFSNSKSMIGVLDIQRDHVELIEKAMHHLKPGGTLFFSTNYQKFKLDPVLAQHFEVRDITQKTLDKDYSRQRIHQVWEIC